MKRNLVLAAVLSLILLSSAAALADGDIYVGGPWGTKITRLPYSIDAPGAYYLGGNLSFAGEDGIEIISDNVTLDLMGYTLSGPGSESIGIRMFEPRKNVEVRNGTLSNCGKGILFFGYGHRIINVRAEGNAAGISLWGTGHLIKGCRATAGASGGIGFYIQAGGTISGCQIINFDTAIQTDGNSAITGNVIAAPGNGGSFGLYTGGSALIMSNEVNNATKGIYCINAATIIGNTVVANTGQTGITVPTNNPTLLDQNTVRGAGTHYQGITPPVTVTRNNAG